MLCFAHTWQFVQCWCTDFFVPFQWYLFFSDAYVLLKPLWPCLSCAKMRRQDVWNYYGCVQKSVDNGFPFE